jgi:hypothetical protein
LLIGPLVSFVSPEPLLPIDQMSEFEPVVTRKKTVDPSGEIAQRPVMDGAYRSVHEAHDAISSAQIAPHSEHPANGEAAHFTVAFDCICWTT